MHVPPRQAARNKQPYQSDDPMAENSYDVNHESGADMDYPEHQKTYDMFLTLSKWVTIFCVVLLLSMAVGFFMGGGFIGGLLFFAVLMIAAKIIF